MPPTRQVYLLDPQKLDPETIAVTFAKTSRSPQSFAEIAAELTAEKSAEFHEKWVVGYGHASVAEHAVLHLAVENLSRLAVESLESNRLASYTEKSTRYQKWSPDAFYLPQEVQGSPLEELYTRTCRRLFEAYQAALPRVRAVVWSELPPQPGESESAWERRCRSEYVDVCRFFLPAAALANVGVTINARNLEHAITKLLSHPLAEVRALGAEIKAAAQAEVPTLVKYADASPYLDQTRRDLTALSAALPAGPSADWCRLLEYDPAAEERVLAAALFRFNNAGYAQALEHVRTLTPPQRRELADALLAHLGRFDTPLRELEYAAFTFEVTLDQGAYAELKRHRMMTQTPQPLTPLLGYAVPRRITAAGLEEEFHACMQQARQAYEHIAALSPDAAAYLVPNACHRRVLLRFNLRAALHFVALRTAPNAHFSMRRVAHRMAEEIQRVSPLLGSYLRPAPGETWQQIERDYFTRA